MPGIVNGVGLWIIIPKIHEDLWVIGNRVHLVNMRFIPSDEADLSFSFNKHRYSWLILKGDFYQDTGLILSLQWPRF